MRHGVVMMDLEGKTLSPEEHSLIRHPSVGGIIFFSRNYEDIEQLRKLVHDIRATTVHKPFLLAVDHEGGRVWRFKDGFSRLGPARDYGREYDKDPAHALNLAQRAGQVMAQELLDCGIDLSLAPILDLDSGISSVIGDRAFHEDPRKVVVLARAFIEGMAAAGMKATGKHFPGHGGCALDSHIEKPRDDRALETLWNHDLVPFRALHQDLGAIMPAHVIYDAVDAMPAGFSRQWLQPILREKIGFEGAIISDCLSMKGAAMGEDTGEVAVDLCSKGEKALDAGCDMLIVCQQSRSVLSAFLNHLNRTADPDSTERLKRLAGNFKNPFV
jgi:beta-N-acetylhexosaminidase